MVPPAPPDVPGPRSAAGRSLKTAADALTVLRLLGADPDGATAERLAAALGKSPSTARYLLNTLCQEGFAVREGAAGSYRLADAPPWGEAWGRGTGPERCAPIMAPDGRVAASIAISTRARRFAVHGDESTAAIREVAATATRSRRDAAPAPRDPCPANPDESGR